MSSRAPLDRDEPTSVSAIASISPGIELARVGPIGLEPADLVVPDVGISPTALTVRGREVVTLRDGHVANAPGPISALRDALSGRGGEPIAISVDHRIPSHTLVRVLRSSPSRASLLVRSGAHQMSFDVGAKPTTDVPAIVVGVAADQLVVWSAPAIGTALPRRVVLMRGDDGDLEDLALGVTRAAMARPDARIEVVLVPEDSVPFQRVADVVAAVAATDAGARIRPIIVAAR